LPDGLLSSLSRSRLLPSATIEGMTLGPEFDEPALGGLQRLDDAVDRGQARVFRVLWFFLPPGSVARNSQFQQLLASRFLTDIALQALLYGALIASARAGGRAIDAALLGVAYLLPGVLLGMFGGIVADALPKRVALGGAYILMGALAILIPSFFGTDFRSLLGILFAVRILHQVSQPSEASAVPLVASEDELASATSFLSLASSGGDVIGKAILAPLIVRAFGVDPVTVIAGLLFFFSATRVFDLRPPQRRPGVPALSETPEVEARMSTLETVRWLLTERAQLWMLLLAALAATMSVILGVLGPQYTRDVLDVDPANALYVFSPAVLGLLVALVVAPIAIKLFRERIVAILGFAIVASAMSALGFVDKVREWLPWFPVVDLPRVGERVELAAEISIFVGFGLTLAATATQTYISRTAPLAVQGRTFALLGTMKDGLAIVPLLVLGVVADLVGVRAVLTVAPLLLLAIAVGVDRLAGRLRGADAYAMEPAADGAADGPVER
jgi:hypothetical protein